MTAREKRFYDLRERLIKEINRIKAEGEPGKMYEGYFEIRYQFPDASDCWNEIINKPCGITIHLDCYLVGPNRHYDWHGKTFEEALDKCEKDITEWIERGI